MDAAVARHGNANGGSPTALDRYLEDVSRYPLLHPEQEAAFAARAFLGDVAAIDALVCGNLRFVVSVAKRFQNRGVPLTDLIQEGNLGLMTAARKFDPAHGVKFITYAVWWIRQAIMAAIAKHSRPVRLPVNRATDLNRLLRIREARRTIPGVEPTIDELADAAALSPAVVRLLLGLHQPALRLDAPVSHRSTSENADHFLVDSGNLVDVIDDQMRSERIGFALQRIRPRDARVLRLYYGLQGEPPHTLEQIGTTLGVTRERVRQLRDRGLEELRRGEYREILETYATA